MTAQEQQIVTSYEQLQLSPEQIAEQMDDLDVVSIKACLFQYSHQFKILSRKDDNLNFNDNDLVDANETILRLMRYAEDENLQARLARYVRDDKKGRLDIGSNLTGTKMNVTVFNTYLNQARESIRASKETMKQLINIETATEKIA